MPYANKTRVPVEKTKYEIETILRRYKADKFVSGWGQNDAYVAFSCRNLLIKFVVPLPDQNSKRFTFTERGKRRPPHLCSAEYEQATRSVWRSLLLCIKAKLESIEAGIETFEEAFLAHVVLPGGDTVGQWAKTAIPEAYASGAMPTLALTT